MFFGTRQCNLFRINDYIIYFEENPRFSDHDEGQSRSTYICVSIAFKLISSYIHTQYMCIFKYVYVIPRNFENIFYRYIQRYILGQDRPIIDISAYVVLIKFMCPPFLRRDSSFYISSSETRISVSTITRKYNRMNIRLRSLFFFFIRRPYSSCSRIAKNALFRKKGKK